MQRLPKFSEAPTSAEEEDSAIQSQAGPQAMPPTDFNFEGIPNLFGGWPPDTQGDIGANHYIQWINLHFAIWSIDRAAHTATLVYGPAAGNALWQGFGGACETTNSGDPITLYDSQARRWFMSQFALPNFPNGPFYVCIAVSTTDDPTGAWHRYAYQWTNGAGQPVMNDYPKFGVWPDGYYMTVNQFSAGTLNWAGAGVAAFERAQMLQGLPAQMVKFDLYSVNSAFGGMLPSDLDGPTPPPAGAPNVFAEVDDAASLPPNDAMRLWQFHVDWTHPLSSTFGVSGQPNTTLAIANFNPLTTPIPQPGTPQTLDTLADRLMYRLAYRNFGDHAALVVNHTVDAGSARAGVRWYEVRDPHGLPAIYQQGTYAPADGLYRWMGSIALDHNGNAALGYSASSNTVYPSIRYTGRLAGDPLDEMAQGEAEIIAGSGSQTGHYRWGDYSMMGIDPVDDCTFWYTQEYVQTTGSNTWQTHVGAFKFPSCSVGPQGVLAGVISNAATSQPIVGAHVQATASPTQTASATSGAGGAYSAVALVGTYTVTASAYAYLPSQITGVSIISGTTTTLNIALTPAATYIVSGTIRDSVTGWPLYANLDMIGYPGGSIWNDPVTGYYSITLAEGITYTFNVAAGIPGYLPASRSVGPLTANRTENFALSADPATCRAPGYIQSPTGVYSQTFEASNGGYWISGYTSWAWGMPSSGPGFAHSGVNVWATNLMGNYYDYEDGYITSPAIDLSAYAGHSFSLGWWQWLVTESGGDYASVEVSNDGGITWVRVYGEVAGNIDLTWARHTLTLDPAYGVSDFRVRFRLRSNYNLTYPGWYVDDVSIAALACNPQSGGLIVGHVADANTGSALNGATVTNDLGQTTTAFPTPIDPALDDGFYALFSRAGARPVTATMSGGYGRDVHTATVILSGTIRQDFNVPAGWLSYAPSALSASLELGASTTRPFTLTNSGGLATTFDLLELDKGVTPLGPIEKPAFGVKPFRQQFASAAGLGVPPLPSAPPYAAGDVIRSWPPTGLGDAPWGIAYDSDDDTVWVSEGWGSIDAVMEYTPNGAATGRSWTHTLNPNGPADMTFNFNTGMAWIMNVASPDNCIYEMNPDTGFTGARICPGLNVSQRGLAYDPSSDTYFAGSWNDMMIHHFDSTGMMLDEVNVGVPIAGLAYNPDTMHLFVMVNNDPNPIYVLDAANNYAVLGQFTVSQGFGAYSGAGLEIDCDGNLWAVDQSTNTVYQFQSGEATSICARDVPWLSESPISGTVAALNAQAVVIAFNASVPQVTQPGQYFAQLKVKEDTPYSLTNVPVTMTVTAPATWGKLHGTVTGLGYCDAHPAPLADATVFVQSGDGMTWTLTTNVSGTYQVWLDQMHRPLTVTITAAAHQTGQTSGVIVTGQLTTTTNFGLRWLQPCLNASPAQFAVTLDMGTSTTRPLTLTNTGAGSTTFQLREQDRGLAPAGPVSESGTITWLTHSDQGVPVDRSDSGATAAYPGAYRYTPAHPTTNFNVLVYTDEWIHTSPNTLVQQALARLGQAATVYVDGNYGGFETALVSGGPWDLVIWSGENYYAPPSTVTALRNYLLGGGKLAATYWMQLDIPTDPLWGDMGFTYVSNYLDARPAYWWNPTHPIFNHPATAPEWLVRTAPSGFSQGTLIDPLASATAVAGYSLSPASNQAALIIRNDGKAVYKAIRDITTDADADADLVLDGVELWENIITGLLDGFGGDVPWLSEVPITGTISADSAQPISITFDAGVPEVTQPGDYFATLSVASNDPVHSMYALPITLTATAPATWGKLTGTVTGLGYCDAHPAPLTDATVFVQSGDGMTWTLTTNVSGTYQVWLDQMHRPLTVTITAAAHQTGQTSGVIVTGQLTTTTNFGLRWLQPCLNASPTQFAVTLDMGTSTTRPLTLTNTGAGSTTFQLREQDRGSTPNLPTPEGFTRLPNVTGVRSDQASAFPMWPTAPRATAETGVLLIQDSLAWGYDAIQSTLNTNGIPYTAINSSQIAATDFAPYRMIIIPSVQGGSYNTAFNANLFKFEDYIDAGGLMLMYFCEQNGFVPYRSIPFGGSNNWGPENNNYIVVPGHPIFAGVPNPYSGSSASHSYLSGVLPGDRILVTGGSAPGGNVVMIERDHGAGMLVAGGQTFEFGWGYGQAAGTILTNMIPYYYNNWIEHDVPWLSEAPITGTLAADSAQPIAVTLDASVPQITQPGNYFATLSIATDDPIHASYVLPITMTAVAPATWGKLNGTVTGLGYCDAAPGAPLNDATVFIQNNRGMTWTLATDANGAYQLWLDQAGSPVTLTVSFAEYMTQTLTGITVSGQQTTTRNIDLRLNAPCASQTPSGLSLALVQGDSRTLPLTVTNTGAGILTYSIYESQLPLASSRATSALPTAKPGAAQHPIGPAAPIGPASVRSLPAQRAGELSLPDNPAWFNGLPIPGGLVRYAHAQCDDQPDSFYIISGVDSLYNRTTNVWRYDASTNTWHALAPIPIGQEGPTAACTAGKIYVMGGSGTNQFYIYTVATNTWAAGAALPRNVWGASAGAWAGRVYLIGGDDDFGAGNTSATVNIYNIATDTWLTTTLGMTMPVAAVVPGYAQAGPYVYVVGGWNDASPTHNLTATQRYDMSADTWTIGPAFSGARADMALALTDEALYAIGGDADGGSFFEPTTAVDRLDRNTWPGGAWTNTSDPLPTAMTSNSAGFCTGAIASSEIWSVGGYSGWINSTNFFRPSSDETCYSIFTDVPWLSTTPSGGTVPDDSQDPVSVAFDATGLAPAVYHATLVIRTDDKNAPEFHVPVTLTVSAAMPNLSTSTKVVNKTVANPGDTLTYTLTIINTGNTRANVTLNDPIPADLTYSLGSASHAVYNDAARRIEWQGTLAVGTPRVITFRATVNAAVADGTRITNTLTLEDGINPAVIKTATTVIGNRPDLSTSTKIVDRVQVDQGDTVTYTITVNNSGNVAASVTVTDPLPSGARYVPGSGTINSAPSSFYNDVANRVEWNGSVPFGGSAALTFRAVITATSGALVTNMAFIDDGQGTTINRQAITHSGRYSLYLPALLKN